jgi:hypothetical protein
VFYHHEETTKYLFFLCKFARSLWLIIQVDPTLYLTRRISNIFGNFLNSVVNRFKILRIRVLAVISLLRVRKIRVRKNYCPTQVIYGCTLLLLSWSSRQRVESVESHNLFTEVSIRLEHTVSDIFIQHGWQCCLRIDPTPSVQGYRAYANSKSVNLTDII